MACDCKANKAIYELGKRYGTTVKGTRKDAIKSGVWTAVQYVFLSVFAIIAFPVLFFMVVFNSGVRKNRVLDISRFVKPKKYVNELNR